MPLETASVAPMETPSVMPLISLQAAGVRLGMTQALRDVTLTLHRGDRLALVGSNGSGKTTLLRLLHGVIDPQQPGQRMTSPLQPEGRAAVGAMVFQHPFFLRLSARRNLALALWLRGVPGPERAERVRLALQRVGLESMAERPAHALSGGQQQRLALARAWALQPDILFLDEPTASLDPSAKREVETLIADFARDGVTLVMSTHNLGQAKRLATRVAHLEGGRLATVQPVDRFFDDPHLPEATRQFLKGELPWLA